MPQVAKLSFVVVKKVTASIAYIIQVKQIGASKSEARCPHVALTWHPSPSSQLASISLQLAWNPVSTMDWVSETLYTKSRSIPSRLELYYCPIIHDAQRFELLLERTGIENATKRHSWIHTSLNAARRHWQRPYDSWIMISGLLVVRPCSHVCIRKTTWNIQRQKLPKSLRVCVRVLIM